MEISDISQISQWTELKSTGSVGSNQIQNILKITQKDLKEIASFLNQYILIEQNHVKYLNLFLQSTNKILSNK